MASGLSAEEALARLRATASHFDYRQLTLVDRNGRTASHSGAKTLGTYRIKEAANVVAAGNLLKHGARGPGAHWTSGSCSMTRARCHAGQPADTWVLRMSRADACRAVLAESKGPDQRSPNSSPRRSCDQTAIAFCRI